MNLPLNQILTGDVIEQLKTLPPNCIDCCVTSPPYYGLRDYGITGQIGLEETPELFIAKMVQVFAEVKRVLKPTGTLFLNIGDSYWGGKGKSGCQSPDEAHERNKDGKSLQKKHQQIGGDGLTRPTDNKHPIIKPKDLIGIPWMLAFALRADGWYLRQDIIWHKPNPMPESVTDRCTKAHEYIFLLTKNNRYFFDAEAIKDESLQPDDDRGARGNRKRFPTKEINGIRASGVYPKANKRSVWTITTSPFSEAHFATFPEELPSLCIKAGCPIKGIVLDPFFGAGTTGLVAAKLNRQYIGIELNPKYVKMAEHRIRKSLGLFHHEQIETTNV